MDYYGLYEVSKEQLKEKVTQSLSGETIVVDHTNTPVSHRTYLIREIVFMFPLLAFFSSLIVTFFFIPQLLHSSGETLITMIPIITLVSLLLSIGAYRLFERFPKPEQYYKSDLGLEQYFVYGNELLGVDYDDVKIVETNLPSYYVGDYKKIINKKGGFTAKEKTQLMKIIWTSKKFHLNTKTLKKH